MKLVCARDKSSFLYLDPTSYNNTQNHTVGRGGAGDASDASLVIIVFIPFSGHTVQLILFSPWACPKVIEDFSKPSTGTVLLIMFFISLLSYFLVGVTVNALYLGARGVEMIPNLDFWRSLPGLVRVRISDDCSDR